MTVNSSESRVEYNCNGSVTAFAFAFRIFTASDLKVYTSDSSGDTLLELGTHYTVTGLDGGTVNTLTAYPSGTKIIIVRLLPLTSEFDPEESGAIPSEALEASIDRLVMIAQQLAAQSGRGLVLPITEQSSMELPGVGTRANKFLFFGADGSVSVKGLAEIGALTTDDSTIIMLDNTLSLKDGGITTAKLSQEVIDLIDAAAADAVDIHDQDADPHTGKFIPVGTIIINSHENIPSGYLECDGTAISRTAYADLFAIVGTRYGVGDGLTTFNIPDYRGQFLRGWDNTAGNDPDAASRADRGDGTAGDVVGSKQDFAIENITGNLYHIGGQPTSNPSSDGVFTETASYNDGGASGGGLADNAGDFSFDASSIVNTSTETRPKNINVQYLIKY